jgi:hypothetical protein
MDVGNDACSFLENDRLVFLKMMHIANLVRMTFILNQNFISKVTLI